jgi:hypothetical protein
VYCVLCTVYCVLCTVYCVLCTVYCVLCTVYLVLCTMYCVLRTRGFGDTFVPIRTHLYDTQLPRASRYPNGKRTASASLHHVSKVRAVSPLTVLFPSCETVNDKIYWRMMEETFCS